MNGGLHWFVGTYKTIFKKSRMNPDCIVTRSEYPLVLRVFNFLFQTYWWFKLIPKICVGNCHPRAIYRVEHFHIAWQGTYQSTLFDFDPSKNHPSCIHLISSNHRYPAANLSSFGCLVDFLLYGKKLKYWATHHQSVWHTCLTIYHVYILCIYTC
jgi:hypothetical protein